MFIGLLAGYCAALSILIVIDKWKERKSKVKLDDSLSTYTKLNALSDIELDESYEECIAHVSTLHDYKDLEKAWNKAIDKAYEKHVKVLNGEEKESEEKCFE